MIIVNLPLLRTKQICNRENEWALKQNLSLAAGVGAYAQRKCVWALYEVAFASKISFPIRRVCGVSYGRTTF